MMHRKIFLVSMLFVVGSSDGSMTRTNKSGFNELLSLDLLSLVNNNKFNDTERKLQISRQAMLRDARVAQKALYYVVANNKYEYIELFFMNYANPNLLTDCKDSLLHCDTCDNKSAQLLIRYGACVNQKNAQGLTPFFKAVKSERFDVARILIKAGANINEGSNEDASPLHWAVNNGNVSAIKLLLLNGAHADKHNNQGLSSYQIALDLGGKILETFNRCKVILFLPTCSVAEPTRWAFNVCFNKNLDYSFLMKMLANDGDMLKKVLRLDDSGYCSSHIVIVENELKEYDESMWADIESNVLFCSRESIRLAKSIAHRTIKRQQLLNALKNNIIVKVRIMLHENPYLLHTYKGEYTTDELSRVFADKFLFIEHKYFFYPAIKALLHEGFDLNVRDKDGRTLLCKMILKKDAHEKIGDVLKVGVSVNVPDNSGKTALSYALLLGDEDTVKVLLRYDAVVNTREVPCIITQSMGSIVSAAFSEQRCRVCKKHPRNMSNIPCVNQHRGSFICKGCYDCMEAHCPLCKRALDEYGM